MPFCLPDGSGAVPDRLFYLAFQFVGMPRLPYAAQAHFERVVPTPHTLLYAGYCPLHDTWLPCRMVGWILILRCAYHALATGYSTPFTCHWTSTRTFTRTRQLLPAARVRHYRMACCMGWIVLDLLPSSTSPVTALVLAGQFIPRIQVVSGF